jgi:hypothetical protein
MRCATAAGVSILQAQPGFPEIGSAGPDQSTIVGCG